MILSSIFVQNIHLAIALICCYSEHFLSTDLIISNLSVRPLRAHWVVLPITHRVIGNISSLIHHLWSHRLEVIGVISWRMSICLI